MPVIKGSINWESRFISKLKVKVYCAKRNHSNWMISDVLFGIEKNKNRLPSVLTIKRAGAINRTNRSLAIKQIKNEARGARKTTQIRSSDVAVVCKVLVF